MTRDYDRFIKDFWPLSYLKAVIVMVISHGEKSDEFKFVLCGVLLAIMAMQLDVALRVLDDGELGRHVVLLVGDAVGIEALHDVLDALRDGHRLFIDDLEVLDFDDGGGGGDEGDLVHVFRLKVLVGDFDEALGAVFLALHVGAEIHGVADFLQAQDLDDLEYFVGGDMVDDGAVLNGAHGQFFFLFHSFEFKI